MRSSGVNVVRGPKSYANLVMVLHFLVKISAKNPRKVFSPCGPRKTQKTKCFSANCGLASNNWNVRNVWNGLFIQRNYSSTLMGPHQFFKAQDIVQNCRKTQKYFKNTNLSAVQTMLQQNSTKCADHTSSLASELSSQPTLLHTKLRWGSASSS